METGTKENFYLGLMQSSEVRESSALTANDSKGHRGGIEPTTFTAGSPTAQLLTQRQNYNLLKCVLLKREVVFE